MSFYISIMSMLLSFGPLTYIQTFNMIMIDCYEMVIRPLWTAFMSYQTKGSMESNYYQNL